MPLYSTLPLLTDTLHNQTVSVLPQKSTSYNTFGTRQLLFCYSVSPCSLHMWVLQSEFHWQHHCTQHTCVDPRVAEHALVSLHTPTHTDIYRLLSGCEEVENNSTSQLIERCNFSRPRNTTFLHEFYLATTQILEYTSTQSLPTRLPHGLVR